MLYRHGDYVGATVNIAARLAAFARRHEMLVSDTVRRAVRDIPDVEFARHGQQLGGLPPSLRCRARAVRMHLGCGDPGAPDVDWLAVAGPAQGGRQRASGLHMPAPSGDPPRSQQRSPGRSASQRSSVSI